MKLCSSEVQPHHTIRQDRQFCILQYASLRHLALQNELFARNLIHLEIYDCLKYNKGRYELAAAYSFSFPNVRFLIKYLYAARTSQSTHCAFVLCGLLSFIETWNLRFLRCLCLSPPLPSILEKRDCSSLRRHIILTLVLWISGCFWGHCEQHLITDCPAAVELSWEGTLWVQYIQYIETEPHRVERCAVLIDANWGALARVISHRKREICTSASLGSGRS